MVQDRDDPTANCTRLWGVRGGTPPYCQKSLLQEVFGYLVIGYHAIGQGIEYAAVAVVEWFHGPNCTTSDSIEQNFIGKVVDRGRNILPFPIPLRVNILERRHCNLLLFSLS